MGKNIGKGNRAARAGRLAAGARKRFTNLGTQLTFAGGAATVTVQAAIDELEKLVELRAASTAARATARDTVKAVVV